MVRNRRLARAGKGARRRVDCPSKKIIAGKERPTPPGHRLPRSLPVCASAVAGGITNGVPIGVGRDPIV
jgi:hypothetical protein